MSKFLRYQGLVLVMGFGVLRGMAEPLTGLTIRDPQLSRFDGTRWLNVSDIISFRQDVDEVLGTVLKIKGRSMRFKELVDYHKRHQLPPKLHQKVVEIGRDALLEKALPHLNNIRRDKALLVRLIDAWAELREKEDSPLKLWGSADLADHASEVTYFHDHIRDIMQLDEFLEQIKLFLGDFLYSCPKSYAQYLECMRIVTEQHEQHAT